MMHHLRLKKLTKCNGNNAAKGISFAPLLDKFAALRSDGKKGSIVSINTDCWCLLQTISMKLLWWEKVDWGAFVKPVSTITFHSAIKKLIATGPEAEREFENEVESLSKIQNHNVISPLGYSVHGGTRLLVYEMMENGSLEFHLHASRSVSLPSKIGRVFCHSPIDFAAPSYSALRRLIGAAHLQSSVHLLGLRTL